MSIKVNMKERKRRNELEIWKFIRIKIPDTNDILIWKITMLKTESTVDIHRKILYIYTLYIDIHSLTADERQALRNHKRNTEVVIREADKESAGVLMSRECYIAEAYRQLSDTDVYQQVSSTVFLTWLKRSRIFCLVFKRVASSPRIWLLMLFLYIENRLVFTFSQRFIRVCVPEDLLRVLLDHLQKVCLSW